MNARDSTALLACAVVAALAAIGYGMIGGDAFYSIDSAVKFIQASSFARSGFRSMALPYPAGAIDPSGIFVPFDPPFVFRNAGSYESIFPSAFAMLTSVLAPYGAGWLRLVSIAAGAVLAAATGWLSDRDTHREVPGLLLLFATPVWFYATATGEATLALACSTLAFVFARRGTRNADLLCGLLLGLSAILRDESLLLLPGLLYARYRLSGGTARYAWCLAGVAIPIVVMGAVDDLWLGRPVLAHLRHAAPFLNAVLPRSRAVLPHLPPLSWGDRYGTIVHYWLLGGGTPLVALAAFVALAAAAGFRKQAAGPILVAAILAMAVALQVRDLAPLVTAPRFLAGLLRLSPFLLLALLPAAPGSTPSPARAVTLFTAAAYFAVVWLSLSTTAGKGLGPRLTLSLWPLLVVAAWDGLAAWRSWAGPRPIRAAIVGCGSALVVGSVVMELGVALPAWVTRAHQDQEALQAIRRSPTPVIVLDDDVDIQVVGADYFDRRVMFVARPALWPQLGAALGAAGEREFMLVSRSPSAPRDVPPYRFAGEEFVERYHLQHFIR